MRELEPGMIAPEHNPADRETIDDVFRCALVEGEHRGVRFFAVAINKRQCMQFPILGKLTRHP